MYELKQWLLANPSTSKKPLGRDGAACEWMDESTWMTYDEANKLIEAGIATHCGFVFTANDPYLVLDLDNKKGDPNIASYISEIVGKAHEAKHYVEQSFSGLGYHIFFKGQKNSTANKSQSKIVEFYDSARFVIVTGNGNGNDIKSDQGLADYFDEVVGDSKASQMELEELPEEYTDEQVLGFFLNAANGEANRNLYYNHVEGDASSLDQSLIERLCFYTKSNEQVRRLFKGSIRAKRQKIMSRGNEYINRSIMHSRSVNEYEKPNINFEAPPVINRDTMEQEKELDFPPGLAGHLSNYLYINSVQPVKIYAITNALTTLAGIVGRKYSFRTSTINLFQLIIGRSGVGKDASRKPLFELRRQLSGDLFNDYFGPEAASGQALFANLETQPCYSVYTGELGDDILMISNIKASDNQKTMLNAYLRLYDEQDFGGKVHRDSKNNVAAVERPAVTIMGSGTPDFFEQLSDHAIKRGLIPRFIIQEYNGKTPQFNEMDFMPANSKIIKGIRNILTYIAQTADKPIEVEYANEEVRKRSMEIRNDIVNMQDIAKTLVEQGLYNRVHLNICRVASVLAAVDNPAKPVITMPILEWATKYVRHGLDHMIEKYHTGDLGGNTAMQQSQAILNLFSDWYSMQPRKRASYSKELMDKPLLLPHRYLDARTKMMACFTNDPRGHQRAVKETIYNLEIADRMFALSAEQKKQHKLKARMVYARAAEL